MGNSGADTCPGSSSVTVILWDPSLPRALDVYPEQDHAVIDDTWA